MVYMSPFLRNQLGVTNTSAQKTPTITSTQHHDKIYEDLTRKANTVRPNEAKAKLVKENFVTSTISSVKDMGQDVANFSTAVKTGKMNDTRLGKINDLGLKIGTGLIATFLAINSKTKTQAIMQFIGGAAFLASMKLWPKIFINAPAKAVHGFDIGQKYISAQGDKKDFFLDNQFLPWDAYSKEEIDEIGRRMGIDPNGKNAQEKIQRKMQKTALQNRTLWMATAGFATPLMASLISNRIEPVVKNTIISNGVNKAKSAFGSSESLEKYLANVKPEIRNQEELERIVNFYKNNGKKPDKEFYEKVAKILSVEDVYRKAFNPDDLTIIDAQTNVKKALEELGEECKSGKINPDKLQEVIRNLKYTSTANLEGISLTEADISSLMENTSKRKLIQALLEKGVQKDKISKIIESLNGDFSKGTIEKAIRSAITVNSVEIPENIAKEITAEVLKNPTMDNLRMVLGKHGIVGVPDKALDGLFDADYSKFYDSIIEYNKTDLAISRARLKKYMKLVNPVVGSREEALSTKLYEDSMNDLFKQLGFDYKAVKKIANESTNEKVVELLSNTIQSKIGDTDESYKEFIEKITKTDFSEAQELAEKMAKDENLAQVTKKSVLGRITDAIFGKKVKTGRLNGTAANIVSEADAEVKPGTIIGQMRHSILSKIAEMKTTKLKTVLCANFERRLKAGEFKDWSAAEIEAARKMIYDSTMSLRANGMHLTNAAFDNGTFKDINGVAERVFDASKFATEKQFFPELEDFISKMKDVIKTKELNASEKYVMTSGLTDSVKKYATQVFNSKTWLRTFAPIAAVLAGLTLLAQFSFGKIKKEYPEEKNGGVK